MLFFDVWSENAELNERLMEIHANPPILYYGFNMGKHACVCACIGVRPMGLRGSAAPLEFFK